MPNLEQECERMLASTQAELKRSQQAFDAMDQVDLSGFEKQITELCSKIAALPKEAGQKFASALKNIAEELSVFSEKLIKRRDAIKAELQGLGTHAQAQMAYRKTQGSTSESSESPQE